MKVDAGVAEPITVDILEEISGTEFNERLISLPVFTCKKCSNILTAPITLVKDLGNVCGICKANYNNKVATQNYALEVILENLIIPCCYCSNGCNKKLNYCDITTHQSACKYRNCTCPLNLFNACTWEGCLTYLRYHFSDEHADLLHQESDGQFKLDISIAKDVEMIKLLCNKENNFILRSKYNLEDLKLHLIMYYIKDTEKLADFLCTIELGNSGIERNKFDGVVSQAKDVPADFDLNIAISINLSCIRQLLNADKTVINTSIKIEEERVNCKGKPECFDEKLLKAFECPVCNMYMKPPIALCLKGHSVCSRCKLKSDNCPLCEQDFSDASNFALEQFSNEVHFPCYYYDKGCCTILKGPAIVEHELECIWQQYPCPISAVCNWKGNYSEIADHLQTHSESTIIHSNHYMKYINLKNSNSDIYFMAVHDRIFRVYNKIDLEKQFCWWSVRLIGPRSDARTYKYEIGFIDRTVVDKKLQQSRICYEWGSKITSDQYMSMPLQTLRQFSNCEKYATYCKISKVVDTKQKKELLVLLSE